MNITGLHAVALAELLAPHVQIFRRVNGANEQIDMDTAKLIAASPERNNVFVPCTEARVLAIIERASTLSDAVSVVGKVSDDLEQKFVGERTKFIRMSAAQNYAAMLSFDPSAANYESAVDAAEALDKVLWNRLEAEGADTADLGARPEVIE
jgi:hypothetical protein